MATLKKRVSFFESEEGIATLQNLRMMTESSSYNTDSSYSANTVQHPDNTISFIDKHMTYLNTHPAINPSHYVSNLRLRTRI